MSAHRFHRLCAALGLAVVLCVGWPFALAREHPPDVAQVWLGGAMLARGEPAALYPLPTPGARLNAGFSEASVPRPAYERLARAHGVYGHNRFVYPPTAAVVFAPLGGLGYGAARRVWTLCMCLAAAGVAWSASLVHARLAPRPTYGSGVLLLVVAGSPLSLYTLRTGNVSALLAALYGVALLGAWPSARRSARGSILAGAALGADAAIKPTGVGLLVVAAAAGRWRACAAAAATLAALALATLLVAGRAPFRVFFDSIVPTLARSAPFSSNQSLPGAWMRWTGVDASRAIALVGLAAWIGFAALCWRRRASLAADAHAFCAAGAAALALVLVFAPLAWAHYHLAATLTWGFALAEGRRSRPRAWLARASMGLAWVPLCVFAPRPFPLPEPLRSHMLASAVATLALAFLCLARPLPSPPSRVAA